MFFPPFLLRFCGFILAKKGKGGGTESFWEVIQFYHDRRAISRKAIMQVRKGEIEKKATTNWSVVAGCGTRKGRKETVLQCGG